MIEISPMPQSAPAVMFSMTKFVWNSDAAVFVFKNGKANIDRDNVIPGKPMKIVHIGDEPNEAHVETFKTKRSPRRNLQDDMAGASGAVRICRGQLLPGDRADDV